MAHHCISKARSRRLSNLARIIARDGGSCVWCGLVLAATHSEATVEHVLPLSNGGPNIFENMLLACGNCNHRRQSVPARTWLAHCEAESLTPNRNAVEGALAALEAVGVRAPTLVCV